MLSQKENVIYPRLKIKKKKKNYYELLGVIETSTEREIKKAYRKIALEQHPDKVKSKEEKEKRQELFVKLANIYEILSDQVTRARYDFLLEGGQLEYEDRNWEEFDAKHGFQKESRIAKIVFGPSPLGFTFNKNIVDNILQNGQAEKLGVSVGWCIIEVNGESQSKDADAIQQAINKSNRNGEPTVIFFEKRKVPRSWKDANDILQSTEEKEGSQFRAIIVSFSLAGVIACLPGYRLWKKQQKKKAAKEFSSEQKRQMKEEQEVMEEFREKKKKLMEQAKVEQREYQRARRKELAEIAAELGEEEKPKKKIFKCELCKKKI